MNVVGYVRVSLDSPVEDVIDAAQQEGEIRAWATRRGHRFTAVFRDEGFSASRDLKTRLGLADALRAVRDGAAGGIAVARLERLTADLVLQEYLFDATTNLGGRWFSAIEAEDAQITQPTDPTRRLIRDVLSSLPEHQVDMRDLWVRQRMRRFPATDDSEEAALARIEHLAEQGFDAPQIARALTDEGFRPHLNHMLNITGLRRIIQKLAKQS